MTHHTRSTDTAIAHRSNSRPIRRRRIFIRTAMMAWFLVVFTAVVFLFSTVPYQRKQLLEEMRQRAKVVYTSTAQVAIESILLEDFSGIVDHCINMVSRNPSLKYVVLTREDGFSLVHTRAMWQQEKLDGLWLPLPGQETEDGRFLENQLSDGTAYHLSYHLSYSGIDWGWIHLGLSPEKFYKDLRALYTRTFVVAMVAVVGGLAASFVYARRLSVPIQRLDRFARKIAEGNLSEHIHIKTGDEVQSLAESFNHMVEELNRSNRKLIETARQAGMAEMAVDVLHNVGNALNSVGVTAQDLKRKVGQSKMASLRPLVELMQEKGETLSDYIANDPRGQKLPAYLLALSAHLDADHQSITTGLNDLERHIHHIQDIVCLQQHYSRTSGMTEQVNIADVINDAIALNMAAIQRHDIRIETQLETMPKITLDRHKLLQILINLISNAKQACHNGNGTRKQIHIRMYRPGPKRFCIKITDNGMGIAKENLTRIFQYGFTTRHDGHGFGLHSSAIAVCKMDGTLQAESTGLGRGATFTIELPIRTVEIDHEHA